MSERPLVSVVVVTYDSERVRHTEPFEPDLHLDGFPAGDQGVMKSSGGRSIAKRQ